jgi:hypothetical protein
MALETATYISDLVSTNPTASDPLAQGDDHIRMLKAVLKTCFPSVNGALSASMIPFTPTGNIAAATVSGALAELDSEKAAKGLLTNGEFTFGASVRLLGRTTAGAGAGEEISVGTGLALAAGVLSCTYSFTPSGALISSGYTQNTARLIGRTTAAAGAPEEITVGAGLSLAGGSLTCTVTGGVTSVNGNSGAVTAAQISAAATTGYGYTPAPKDFGAGSWPVGSVICGFPFNSANNTVTHTAGSTYAGSVIYKDVYLNASYFFALGATVGVGTWRVIGSSAASIGDGVGCTNVDRTTYQRIA